MKDRNSKRRRVVVTGLGVVSSLGIGWEEFWKNLLAGKSGISKVEVIDTSGYERHYAGEIKGFNGESYIDPRKLEYFGKSSQFGVVAAKLALSDAGIVLNGKNADVGLCVGTTMGEAQLIEKMVQITVSSSRPAIKKVLPLTYPANSISANIANELGLLNNNLLFSTACAAGNYSVAKAYDLITSGKADRMLAGGVDSLSRIAFTGFSRLFAMAPEKCCPFDKNRKGMMVGEGAGILVLESLKEAEKRGAKIYAEVLGYGLSCDAHHMTNPSSRGVVAAVEKALASSNVDVSEVDYISAHGTGTKENDKAECEAFEKVFNSNLKSIPVSSIKSMLGHTMGAASALEAIVCCLTIKDGQIPPTINHETDDPECSIDCVPNTSRKHKVNIALNNSQAFGGNNACLILRGLNYEK